MSGLRDQIKGLDRARGAISMYGRGSAAVDDAKAALRTATEGLRRAKKKKASGTAAVRFQDWRPTIERSYGAWLSGDRLDFHWIAFDGNYGRFVQGAVQAEGDHGHVGGATFYDTQHEMLAAKKAAGPLWVGTSIWYGR